MLSSGSFFGVCSFFRKEIRFHNGFRALFLVCCLFFVALRILGADDKRRKIKQEAFVRGKHPPIKSKITCVRRAKSVLRVCSMKSTIVFFRDLLQAPACNFLPR